MAPFNEEMRLFIVVSGKLIKKLKARNKVVKQQPPIISPVVLFDGYSDILAKVRVHLTIFR